ncbi:MAG: MopE-related protein [Sandaracinaceae bacterium]
MRPLPLVFLLLVGCTASHRLTVDLVTPREGGVAFDRVRVTLDPSEEAAEHAALAMTYASPVRVAEFDAIPEDVYAVTVSLLLGEAVVAEQRVMVWVRNDASVVVTVGAEVCVPATEVCNGMDDDCDEAIDEEASDEVCNGRDDDCDGEVDEGSGASLCPAADAVQEVTCVEGACGVGACVGTRADCDSDYANGCEADTARDGSHCGGCGVVCEAEAFCDASTCRLRGRPAAFARLGDLLTDRVLGMAPRGDGVYAGGVESRFLETIDGSEFIPLSRGWVESRDDDGSLAWRTQRLGPVMAVASGPGPSVVGVSRPGLEGTFTELDCSDGRDDDCDRLVDCFDPDCRGSAASSCDCEGPERCANGGDDDCDGHVDCQDPDCAGASACDCTDMPEVCDDGIDNDCDGDVDCADEDCEALGCECGSLEIGEFRCDDGLDNDCDGLTDGNDPNCAGVAPVGCTDRTPNVAFALDDEGAQLWESSLAGTASDIAVAGDTLHVIASDQWLVGSPTTGVLGPGLNDPEAALRFLAVDAYDGRVGLVFSSSQRVTVEIGGQLRGYPANAYAVAMLDEEGQFLWDRVFTQQVELRNVGVSRAGLAVRGRISISSAPVDLGAGPVEPDPQRTDFIVVLSESGEFLFERRVPDVTDGDAFPRRVRPIAMSATGDVWTGGTVDEETDFGGGRRPTYLPAGWVAVYDASGSHRWDQVYVNPGAAYVEALVTTPEGGWVGGSFDSRVEFGLGPAMSAGEEDGFLLRVDD